MMQDDQLNKVLDKLEQAVDEQQPGVSKEQLYSIIDDKFNDTLAKLDTYRKVEDKPDRVNIVDISDNARKKLENLLNQDGEPQQQIDPEQLRELLEKAGEGDNKSLLQKIGGKLLDWAGNILDQVFKLVSTVTRWTVNTFMGLIKNVSEWIIHKIQVAVGIGAARGAVGGLAARRGIGRSGALRLLGGGMAAGGLALGAWAAHEGLNELNTFADSTTNQVNQLFPEGGASFMDVAQSLPSGQMTVTDDGMLQMADPSPDAAGSDSTTTSATTSDTQPDDVTTSEPAAAGVATTSPPDQTNVPPAEIDAAEPPVKPEIKPADQFVELGGMTEEQTKNFMLELSTGGIDDPDEFYKEYKKRVTGVDELEEGDDLTSAMEDSKFPEPPAPDTDLKGYDSATGVYSLPESEFKTSVPADQPAEQQATTNQSSDQPTSQPVSTGQGQVNKNPSASVDKEPRKLDRPVRRKSPSSVVEKTIKTKSRRPRPVRPQERQAKERQERLQKASEGLQNAVEQLTPIREENNDIKTLFESKDKETSMLIEKEATLIGQSMQRDERNMLAELEKIKAELENPPPSETASSKTKIISQPEYKLPKTIGGSQNYRDGVRTESV